jgi:hypothetical protein
MNSFEKFSTPDEVLAVTFSGVTNSAALHPTNTYEQATAAPAPCALRTIGAQAYRCVCPYDDEVRECIYPDCKPKD